MDSDSSLSSQKLWLFLLQTVQLLISRIPWGLTNCSFVFEHSYYLAANWLFWLTIPHNHQHDFKIKMSEVWWNNKIPWIKYRKCLLFSSISSACEVTLQSSLNCFRSHKGTRLSAQAARIVYIHQWELTWLRSLKTLVKNSSKHQGPCLNVSGGSQMGDYLGYEVCRVTVKVLGLCTRQLYQRQLL